MSKTWTIGGKTVSVRDSKNGEMEGAKFVEMSGASINDTTVIHFIKRRLDEEFLSDRNIKVGSAATLGKPYVMLSPAVAGHPVARQSIQSVLDQLALDYPTIESIAPSSKTTDANPNAIGTAAEAPSAADLDVWLKG